MSSFEDMVAKDFRRVAANPREFGLRMTVTTPGTPSFIVVGTLNEGEAREDFRENDRVWLRSGVAFLPSSLGGQVNKDSEILVEKTAETWSVMGVEINAGALKVTVQKVEPIDRRATMRGIR